MRRLAVLLAVLALAGCGGGAEQTAPPTPPRLPRALAQSWAQQADEVASALAAGDGCTAQRLAGQLRTEVAGAAGRAPQRLLAALGAAVEDLPDRITCNPPPTPTPAPKKHEKPKPPKHEHHHKDDHGKKKH